jgi:hypothetical protein
MKICRPRPQLVFTFDNRFSSTGFAAQQSVRYIIFRLQASYLSATSHTGRESCRVKSLYMKRFWYELSHITLTPVYEDVYTHLKICWGQHHTHMHLKLKKTTGTLTKHISTRVSQLLSKRKNTFKKGDICSFSVS